MFLPVLSGTPLGHDSLVGRSNSTLAPRAAHGSVRSTNADIRRLVVETRERSATFNRLVGCIEESHVVAYLVPALHLREGLNAGLQLAVAGADPIRYLKIHVRPGLPADRLVVVLAHELAHICEAARAGALTSTAALAGYFRVHAVRVTGPTPLVYETAAGDEAASSVLRELREPRTLLVRRGPASPAGVPMARVPQP
jgi:hypothetical protein